MKVLIIGSGAREYSIGLAIKKDKRVEKIYFSNGNGGTSFLGENINIENYDELADFAIEKKVDLTIVGAETPLVNGVVDIFKEKGLNIFGPSKKASKLEGSKIFMKNFLKKYNIPTAQYIETSSATEGYNFIDKLKLPIVIKADGLCAGKGVIISQTYDEAKNTVKNMLSGEMFGEAGKKIVIEEFLDGYELSIFAICDEDNYKILPAVQDHKKLLNGDLGPNTGGMGAYSPTLLVNDAIYEQVDKNIIIPTLAGMKNNNSPFQGVLFIGLMIVDKKAIVLEYNIRFGDPECEVIMPLIKSSVFDMFYKASTGNLSELNIQFEKKYAVGVVLASKKYPYSSSKDTEIIIDQILHDNLLKSESHISFAGVKKENNILYASGGRVLVAVGVGNSLEEAKDKAYLLIGQIHFAGKQCRTDIAYQAMN